MRKAILWRPVITAVRDFSKQHYYLAKSYVYVPLVCDRLMQRNPLLIYQMGKVGSSTITDSLTACGVDRPIYRLHWLSRRELDREISEFLNKGIVPPRHIWKSEFLEKQVKQRRPRGKWDIVTLVRDPIARNISAFFQNIDKYVDDFPERYAQGLVSVPDLIDTFINEFRHSEPLEWFDYELKEVFGIDVFASEFDLSAGFRIYENSLARVLLLRTEDVSSSAQEALSDFLGDEGITISNTNVGQDKDYNAAYKKFIGSIALPHEYITTMYTSKLAQHFYSVEELKRFSDRWTRSKA